VPHIGGRFRAADPGGAGRGAEAFNFKVAIERFL
jgi:hypothetical protein